MRRTKVLGIAAVLLASSIGLTVHATNDSLSQAQQNVEQANKAVDSAKDTVSIMESELDKMKKTLADIEATKGTMNEYIEKLDKQLSEQTQLVKDKEAAVEQIKQDIVNTEENLKEAEKIEREQYELMKVRIKYMYENGDTDYLSILLEASSISDFLNRIEYVVELSSYDNRVLEQYQQTMNEIAELKVKLEDEKTALEGQLAELQDGQDSLEYLIDAKQEELEGIEEEAENQQTLIDEYEADIQEQNDTVAMLEQQAKESKKKYQEEQERKKKEEEKKKKNETTTSGDAKDKSTSDNSSDSDKSSDNDSSSSVTVTYDGGTFAWPCPAYTRISSPYGMRMHPTLGVQKFHNGVDLAAPAGVNILAAYGGTVVGAGYNSSMGNYVMIDHGSELYTIYMHASALYVKSGQKVSKGDVIAAVGTTGRSTGNHLHFGVRLNGSYVDPMNYISK